MGDGGGTGGVAMVTLTPRERRVVAVAAAVPVVVVALVLVALVIGDRLGVVDLVVGVVLYGGLLGLTSGVVAHERAVAGHCPRCGAPDQRGAVVCDACGYDLVRRPVYRCEEGHRPMRAPGVCDCGRRLRERVVGPGFARSIRRTLWAGLWLLALLVGTAVLLRVAG